MPTPSPIDAFRIAHPTSTVRLGEREWEYIDARDAERTLLVLPGAIGLAESAWLTISSFTTLPEPHPLRVIAPSYPAEIEVMPDLADGIAALLDALGLERVSLFGSSYGGFVAQMLARRHPQRVERLILSHSVAADPARAERVYRSVGFLRFMREPWLKRNFRKQLQRSLDQADEPLARLNAELMLELAAQRVSGRAIANAYLRLATFDGLWDQQPNAPFAGPTLLLFGGLDPTTPPEEQQRLHEIYPQAQVRLFEDSGHNTAIDHHDAYFATLLEFLTASDAALPPPPAALRPPPPLLE